MILKNDIENLSKREKVDLLVGKVSIIIAELEKLGYNLEVKPIDGGTITTWRKEGH